MIIRKAEERDIPRIIELLGQVLQIHADIRPDIFIPDTTKYTVDELTELLKNEEKPIFVATNEADICVGYAFCQLREQPFSNNMVPFKSLFIDDLCVDQKTRGQHIGEKLFEYVKAEAKQMGRQVVACGLVQNHEVDVRCVQTLERFVNGGVAVVKIGPELGFEKHVFAWQV